MIDFHEFVLGLRAEQEQLKRRRRIEKYIFFYILLPMALFWIAMVILAFTQTESQWLIQDKIWSIVQNCQVGEKIISVASSGSGDELSTSDFLKDGLKCSPVTGLYTLFIGDISNSVSCDLDKPIWDHYKKGETVKIIQGRFALPDCSKLN